jgi:uncharacterized protein involved in outer membrane biogenesis
MRSLIRWTVLAVFGLAAVVMIAVTVMAVLGVTIDLSHLRGGVEISAEKALGRDVQINGPVVLEFSGWPSIEVRDVNIANVSQGQADNLFTASLARLDVRLLSLLKSKLEIGEMTAEHVTLNLENDAQGRANWAFGEALDAAPSATEVPALKAEPAEPLLGFVGLDKLSLQQVKINYYDAALQKSLTFGLDALYGEAASGQPITMKFNGHLQDDRYDLELLGGSVEELLNRDVPWPFTLSGNVSGRRIDASGEIGLQQKVPTFSLVLTAQDLDVGAILYRLGLVEGMKASTNEAGIDLELRGKTLQELVRQSRMTFAISDGQWTLRDPNTQASLDINQLAGNILVQGGTAVTMNLSGNIEQTPVKLVITGATLEEYFATPEKLPLTIDVALLDSRFTFDTKLALPISEHDLKFSLTIAGKRLDNFNELMNLDLPPLGPFSLEAQLRISSKGYDLSTLAMKVGESDLEGRMQLNTALDKPKLDVELLSKLIRVDDFYFGKKGKGKARGQADEAVPADQPGDTEARKQDAGHKYRELLSYEVMNSLDAVIEVESRLVTSGNDKLGSGVLKATLLDGRLALEPLRVDTAGGGVEVGFSLQPRERDVVVTVDADIDHFDYGVLARQVDTETEMNGVMSLDIEFKSTAPDKASIMKNATGHFDFALFPGNFSAEVFDLWAINLLNAVADEVDKDKQSAVNCIVVRLGLESGKMEERVIFMDTTRMTVAGKASVDFNTRKIDVYAAPKAKKAEFFSLATPIKVQGSFEDFGLGVNPLSLTGSVISFVTSPVHVPVRRVFKKKVPADGKQACEIAWTKTADEIIQEQSETFRPNIGADAIRDY